VFEKALKKRQIICSGRGNLGFEKAARAFAENVSQKHYKEKD
jgi:hypothetical protein